jgi:hypothetical protein
LLMYSVRLVVVRCKMRFVVTQLRPALWAWAGVHQIGTVAVLV